MSTLTRNPAIRDAAPPGAFARERDLPHTLDPYAARAALQERPRLYRGRSVDELIPKIVSELGEDAIVIRHHRGLTGGFAGFFQRPFVEIEACRGGGDSQLLDRYDEDDAAPALPGEFEKFDEFEDSQELVETDDQFAHSTWDPRGDGAQEIPEVQDPTPAGAMEPPAPDDWDGPRQALTTNPFAAALAEAEAAVRAAEPAVPPDLDAALVAALAEAEAAELPAEPVLELPPEPALPPDHDTTLADTASLLQAELLDSPPPAVAPISRGCSEDAIECTLLERTLLEVGFDEQLVGEVIQTATAHLLPLIEDSTLSPSPSALAQAVRRALQQRIPVCPPLPPGSATIALVGPGGSGKSACCATLLDAYHHRSTLPAACAAFVSTGLSSGELEVVLGSQIPEPARIDDPDAAQALLSAREEGLLLLDTPPLSPADQASIGVLAAALEWLAPDRVVLALPATLGAKPAGQLLEALRPLGASVLAITHADATDQLGVAVQAACTFGLAPTYLLEGGATKGRLAQIDSAELVDRLLPPR